MHHCCTFQSSALWCLAQEVRQRLFKKVRESIEARLFLAKPPFCAALRQLAALVADMSRVRSLAASPGHLYVLEEYADQQVALREQTTKPGLEGLVEKMQQVSLLRFSQTNRLVPVTWQKLWAGNKRSGIED